MKQYELRSYRIRDGELDAWVAEWLEHVVPLRHAHGFELLGPWLAEDGRFVWIIGHEDFDIADASYYASNERLAIEPDPARHITETQNIRLLPF